MSCMEISYKRRAAITARRKAAELFRMTSPKTVHLDDDPRRETACEISEKARSEGLLSKEEAEKLADISLIIHDRESNTYAAGEICLTLKAGTAAAAEYGASLLSKAAGSKTIPIVVGDLARKECREEAAKLGVTIIIIPDKKG